MPFVIEEMQRVKEKYPQYKDVEDVALLNSIARKFPVYEPLRNEVGERIRKERAASTVPKEAPEIQSSPIARVARRAMGSSALKSIQTTQYLHDNINRIPKPAEGENYVDYIKRFKVETGLAEREEGFAREGTIAQFDDAMTVGVGLGMAAHPASTIKMLAAFGALEKVADVTGINKMIHGVKNATARDVLDIVKFGIEGALAGGMVRGFNKMRAKAKMKAAAKDKPKEVLAAAEKVFTELEGKTRIGEQPVDAKTEVGLMDALKKAESARKKLEVPKPKAPAVISKVENVKAPVKKVADTREARKAKFREELLKRREQRPRGTSPKEQVRTAPGDTVEVTVRSGGKETTKQMTPKQLFELKEQIREGADIRIVDKAQKLAEKKATRLEKAADELLGKRTLKDQIKDINDVIGGKEGAQAKKTPGRRSKEEAAINRLKADAKKSGKALGKYLTENLKLDSASASTIVKAAESAHTMTAQIKGAKKRTVSKKELDAKPVQVSDEIIQEKMRNAKGEQHRKNIAKKYGVKYETPTSDPKIVKDAPEIDPLMEKHTLFNPKDKASVKVNDRINKNLDRAQVEARVKGVEGKANDYIDTTFALQGLQERSGAPTYSKTYLKGTELSNLREKQVSTTLNKFITALGDTPHTVESDTRIVDWITERKGKLSPSEQKVANKLIEITRDIQPIIKFMRMQKWIDKVEKTPKGLRKLVTQGRTILKKQGLGALEEWVKDQDFGVITGDRYVFAKLLRGLRVDNKKANPYATFNPHAKTRLAEETVYDNTIPLAKRLHSYLERVYGDYYFYDFLKKTKAEMQPFVLDKNTQQGFESWLGVIQGHGIPGVGAFGRGARKVRGQFFKTILFDPTKWVRNKLQNVAFLYQNYPLTANIKKFALRSKMKLDARTQQFFDTHVSQLGALRRDYLYLYETKKRGVLGKLDRAATKLAEIYTLTDETNRLTAFKHALAGIGKDMNLYKSGKINFKQFAKRQGLGSLTDLELKHILSLKPEEAKLQIARFIVEKTHVRYKKHERGFAALSELGEAGTSLVQFPKTVISRYIDSLRMIGHGRTFAEKKAGLQLLAGYVAMPMVANEVFQRVAGKKKYYDPDLRREKEYKPYEFLNAVTGINFGGAQAGHAKDFGLAIKLISELAYQQLQGGYKGTKGEKRRLTTIRNVLKIMDRLGESYIPFLRKSLDVVESAGDYKSYKILTTSFDKITNRKSALRLNKIERNLIEKISHAFFGTEREEKKNEGLSF